MTVENRASIDLALVAGEASGDWIGALAVSQLQAKATAAGRPLVIEGIAGPKLREAGIQALHSTEELSVRGYVEVLAHLPRLLRIRSRLKSRWSEAQRPRVFMGIDAPDFNLNLEHHLRQAGVPTVHLVCPSIWAWRRERIEKIKVACDEVLCIFPFEPELLQQAGVKARYIGHPMASIIPMSVDQSAYRIKLGISKAYPWLAVLPGSRAAEVKYLGPVFAKACQLLAKRHPQLRFITPLPAGLMASFRQTIPDELLDRWNVIEGQSHDVLGASDAVLLASGTATLEAMMFKRPMVIAYKMPAMSYRMMKGKGYQPWVGLPNILLKDFAVPEFIQDAATAEALCDAVSFQLEDSGNREKLHQLFSEQHAVLTRDSGNLVAQALGDYLNGR